MLVNNAGTCIPEPVVETSLENFDRVFAINVRGMFVATQAALKHMKRGGRIINIGSCVGESIGFECRHVYPSRKSQGCFNTTGLAAAPTTRSYAGRTRTPGQGAQPRTSIPIRVMVLCSMAR